MEYKNGSNCMSFANGGMKPIKLTKPNCQQAILSFFIPNKMTF